jgi:large conductance mechanosensitive channel
MAARSILDGFRAFIFRGNLIELAVAVVIGVAFGNLINSLVSNLLTPIIALIVGETSFRALDFEINNAIFFYGAFLDDLITFVTICAAIYFFVILPVGSMTARMRAGEPTPDATTKLCSECLSEIPIAARRCAFCAQPVSA